MTDIFSLPTNTFGVELEVSEDFESYHEVARRLRAALTRRVGPQAHPVVNVGVSTGDYWDVKSDGSCGGEVASPALTWDTIPELVTVCDELLAMGHYADDSCGLHVHHHMPNLTPQELRRIWLTWAVFEPVLIRLVDASRLDNEYCRSMYDNFDEAPVQWKSLTDALRPATRVRRFVQSRGRYHTLNCASWWLRGTLEVRLHHGTLDVDEIVAWIKFTQLFLHVARTDISLSDLTRIQALPLSEKYKELTILMNTKVDIVVMRGVWDDVLGRMRKFHSRSSRTLVSLAESGALNV